MEKYKKLIIVVNIALVLIAFNYSIYKNEKLLKEGSTVLFELVPRDSRSLMQGDYMVLNYKNSTIGDTVDIPNRGYLVFELDDRGIGHKIRFQEAEEPLHQNEFILKYTKRNNWAVNFGAESFFFQEGHADYYADAKYGALKIAEDGKSLLVGLYNEKLEKINVEEE
ncbi:GDYXXLXY domain-containing protein [Flammeovirga aprica]|uniref:GDYXXLXY domain-containing protein n=1 Tax=Flammeovirga aprica JL-4 TaxID=694437 RepID=A0A7X9X9V2_9BACT|nr:GDYXXLXY domain-containing protein [Flammeovirga aprica]NME69117.1 GDYXXLXY domain-containing protein [Flammeovirga aprica JL-4]